MCLAAKTNIPSISSTNIECYKILIPTGGKLLTPYRDFCFTIGEVITDTVEAPDPYIFNDYIYLIEAGYFHAVSNLEKAKRVKNKFKKAKIFKAIIPVNTFYFQNEYGDICSKSLKIIEEYCD